MRTTNLLRLDAPPILRWDGRALHGLATSKAVVVAVPARFVSFRIEDLPPAAEPALKAAARMKAERAFAPLGAVAIDAVISPARKGRCLALMMALPKTTIDAIRAIAQTQGHVVGAIRVAELQQAIPVGGVVTVGGEACLMAVEVISGQTVVRGLSALGSIQAPGYAATLMRERLRLGVAEDAPGAPALGAALDFLRPTLAAPPALLSRPGVRLGLLAAGVAVVVAVALTLLVTDAIAARDEAQAQALRLRPLAKALAERRADMKAVAPWLDQRPSLAPGLHVLASALPDGRSDDQVRLVRVRQTNDDDTVVEGTAGDRAQMLGFLDRLRRDQRVEFAEVRSSRSPSKEAKTVVFELVVRMSQKSGGPEVRESGSLETPAPLPAATPPAPTPPSAPPATSQVPPSHETSGPPDLRTSGLLNGGRHAEA